jgi:hypothetical protein
MSARLLDSYATIFCHQVCRVRICLLQMNRLSWPRALVLLVSACWAVNVTRAQARTHPGRERESEPLVQPDEFGPVVTSYLEYLRTEEEVVDDRGSRREITPAYYRRNKNRIRALRQIAVKIARETANDYLPELEAVAVTELNTLFDPLPRLAELKPGAMVNDAYRFLGVVRAGELFYVFARLGPFEQQELQQQRGKQLGAGASVRMNAEAWLAAQAEYKPPPWTNLNPAHAHAVRLQGGIRDAN